MTTKECPYVESQLSAINIDSKTVTVKIHDFEGSATKHFNIDSLESIQSLKSFLEFRELEIRNRS